ncbi:hypothetical protein J437_LFUL012435 [Ladona fulva]|uniref:Endonuclease/exonuclease/phosphatase domain-containing protein n=1 Tax=Ladona fulva TaxID=123851 RepID=A0A8K0KE54_LADFU|nr:hypothetical protein J437_LFUL012435 [Ladona fulva]
MLEDHFRDTTQELVIAGDFNARAPEWGMPQTNKRGRLILEMAARMDLMVLNMGNTPTYRRPGFGNSIPDLSLASETIAAIREEWRIGREMRNRTDPRNKIPHRWNYRKFDDVKFAEKLLSGIGDIPETSQIVKRRENAEDVVSSTMKILKCACDSFMPIIKRFINRKSAYWWTEEIAELRRNCLKLRRKAQRARRGAKGIDYSSEHKSARKELRIAIKRSKFRCWKALCDEVNADPWGLGYKIATQKIGALGSVGTMTAREMQKVVDELFPTHPLRTDAETEIDGSNIPAFSMGELEVAVSSLKNRKTPGPDCIPAEIRSHAVLEWRFKECTVFTKAVTILFATDLSLNDPDRSL